MSTQNTEKFTSACIAFVVALAVLAAITALMVNVVNQRETQRGREKDRIEACATLEDPDQRLTCLVSVGVRK